MEKNPGAWRRWDGDARGKGVASAAGATGDLERLAAEMKAPEWIAEQPEAHLLPHLQSYAEDHGGWQLVSAEAAPDGWYHIHLAWQRELLSPRALRREVFAVIGAIAEHSTHVRERRTDEGTTFEVATGILDGDKGWRAHGHVLVIHIQMPA